MLTRIKLKVAALRLIGYDPFDAQDYFIKRAVKEKIFDPVHSSSWRFVTYRVWRELDIQCLLN